jgi:response regulator RpfG family c-di-GMP phosphodiesterase
VLEIMQKDAGTHFDPKLIELFLNNLDQFLEIKDTYVDDDNAHTIMDIIHGIHS